MDNSASAIIATLAWQVSTNQGVRLNTPAAASATRTAFTSAAASSAQKYHQKRPKQRYMPAALRPTGSSLSQSSTRRVRPLDVPHSTGLMSPAIYNSASQIIAGIASEISRAQNQPPKTDHPLTRGLLAARPVQAATMPAALSPTGSSDSQSSTSGYSSLTLDTDSSPPSSSPELLTAPVHAASETTSAAAAEQDGCSSEELANELRELRELGAECVDLYGLQLS